MTRSKLKIILLESSIEIAPKHIAKHRQIVESARMHRIPVSRVILDKTLHYNAMSRLEEKWKRGRPDIPHITLLNILDSPLAKRSLIDVFIQVYDGRVFEVKPQTRLPRHLDRFKGLMAQLLRLERVPPEGESLIYKSHSTLREFVKDHGGLILLWEKGEQTNPSHIVKKALDTGYPIGVGAFPKGDFRKETLELSCCKYSILGGESLAAWIIASRIVCEAERLLGIW
ncbi:MAG: 16S rRNA methyltransferase [Desulfurococcales archaeon]|nr:16S rRNA methyltransferase [Desulfurococcales archaeon]